MRDPPGTAIAICQIGPLTLDLRNRLLLRDGVPLPLGRRAVALLGRLVQNPGEIVSTEALYGAVWQGRIVEESDLTVQISQLRRVLLGEVAESGGWIVTLARRGYRFAGPVAWRSDPPTKPSSLGQVISNIPIAIALHFTGRASALAALDAALTDASHRPNVVALHGLRGVGKTMLAAVYARAREAQDRATWWLRAETEANLRVDLRALAIRLGWVRPDAAETIAFAAALEGLHRDGEGLLLIYDNAIDAAALRAYLPKGGGARVIVTSNAPAWRTYATPILLEKWPSAIGADYLVARTGLVGQQAGAERLSIALDGLPLAHEQAAAYIACLELSFDAYLRRLDAAPVLWLCDPIHAPFDYHNGQTVAKSFGLAIARPRRCTRRLRRYWVTRHACPPRPSRCSCSVRAPRHSGSHLPGSWPAKDLTQPSPRCAASP